MRQRPVKEAVAVGTKDKICGRSLSSKIPFDMNSIILKLYVTWPTWPKYHIPQIFEFSIKTERILGRNTCDHACQIFGSKGNCQTMYRWFFLLEITVVKIMNNLNFAPPTAIYTHGPGLNAFYQMINFNISQWKCRLQNCYSRVNWSQYVREFNWVRSHCIWCMCC